MISPARQAQISPASPAHRAAAGSAAAARAGNAPSAGAASGASADGAAQPRADTTRTILATALLMERLAATFYYTALTTPAIMRTPQLAGGSGDPTNPGLPPGGNPHHVRFLQAALDAEVKHAALLSAAGAASSLARFYFPAPTFTRLGSSVQADSFLFVLDTLETTLAGLYVAAVGQLVQLGQFRLAMLAGELAGIESEHRLLGRVLSDLRPANNLTLAQQPFATVDAALPIVRPFLTGTGFAGGATAAIALPTAAQCARVIGKYGTRRVHRFL